jgi:hypothetical protein
MKSTKQNSITTATIPFREISLDQISPEPIRIVHRGFTIEIPLSAQPDQLTALVRGLV